MIPSCCFFFSVTTNPDINPNVIPAHHLHKTTRRANAQTTRIRTAVESKKQFAVCDSDTPPVNLKQGQGHQTWYELEDPEQGYNNTKIEKTSLNSVC